MNSQEIYKCIRTLVFFLRSLTLLIVYLLAVVGVTTCALAETTGEPSTTSSQPLQLKAVSLGEQLEDLGRLYKNEENVVLQDLWLLGRYHGQHHWSEGSTGHDNGYETRRFRAGGQARLFKKMTVHAQMISGPDLKPFYNGFSELWAQWSFSPEILLTIGQQKNRFTHDRNVSSRYLNYLERGMLTNMFQADYTPAVTLQGKVQELNYYSGFFSNATGTNLGKEFTELDSGYSFLAAGYYELENLFGEDTAFLHSSYVHSHAKEGATNFNRFDDGVSSALILTRGPGSLVTEAVVGFGSENGNAVGINIQPGYFLTSSVQAVARYQLAGSNRGAGLKPQRRYEQQADLKAGDIYNAGYLGLNYYIAKHRLKLLSGIEYAQMSSDRVWTTSVMIRFYFGPHSGGAFPMNQMLPGEFFTYD